MAAVMTDIMVDLETTDTDPYTGGIIQIGAIKFNYETGEIGEAFDRCPAMLPRRRWSDSTREFWMGKNRAGYMKIVARQEEPVPVFADFFAFAAAPQLSNGLRFWAKPLQFDWTFVDQHFQQMGKPMPFHYRYARDMNSFISGLRANPEHQGMEAVVPFTGEPHNALHDAANQIDQLFAAKRGQFSETFS